MAGAKTFRSERDQLELFRALSGDLAPRDAQDLMAYPFFSLAKTHRVIPIDFRMGEVAIRVEATAEHGMATIWDADVLIWAASQIVEARDKGLRTSRLMAATPYEILTFIRRGTSARDYHRLKAALDRLQSTTIATTLRQATERRMHRFSWVNEWKERADGNGRPLGIELIIPNWLYAAVLNDALVLTIDRAYFQLTAVSSAGSTASFASMLDGNPVAGALRCRTSISSPAACHHSSASPSSCATSRAARRCRASASPWKSVRSGGSFSPSSPSNPIRPRARCVGATSSGALGITRGITCEYARAIRNRICRAIRNPILVLSGTKIRLTPCSTTAIWRF